MLKNSNRAKSCCNENDLPVPLLYRYIVYQKEKLHATKLFLLAICNDAQYDSPYLSLTYFTDQLWWKFVNNLFFVLNKYNESKR